MTALLEVRDLHVEFHTDAGVVHAVNGLDLTLEPGETLAVVGESGSGKSVTAQAIVGVLDSPPGVITGGGVLYRGRDLLTLGTTARREVRGQEIALVLQDALTALNPSVRVGEQIAEVLRRRRGLSRRVARQGAVDLLERVQIPSAAARAGNYPHQFSGGMRQRVLIALALALEPRVLIADEPTTALDVTVQAQIMDLLTDLQQERELSLLLITHDLAAVAEWADRVAIMYAGRVVESGTVEAVYRQPAHPYTRGLISSVPATVGAPRRLSPIPGAPPDLRSIPPGCPFHPRCPYAQPVCAEQPPPRVAVGGDRFSECHFAGEVLRDAG